ncbi:hypothetical protein D3C71_2160880 [compost metagenome]
MNTLVHYMEFIILIGLSNSLNQLIQADQRELIQLCHLLISHLIRIWIKVS